MLMSSVNAVCINKPFTVGTLARMGLHPSMKRLLDFAREHTASLRAADQVRDFAGVAAKLGVTSAVMTNWKARGISKEGALDAQLRLGCNAWWLMDGEGAQGISGWPFTLVSEARWHACSPADQGYVQGAMNAALDHCERQRLLLGDHARPPVKRAGDLAAQIAALPPKAEGPNVHTLEDRIPPSGKVMSAKQKALHRAAKAGKATHQ